MRSTDNIFIRHTTLTGIGVITLLVALIAFMFYRQEEVSARARDMVLHTHEVLGHIQALSGKVKDAQIGQRGYILTGNEEYFRAYKEAVDPSVASDGAPAYSIAKELELLRKTTADNPVQQHNLDMLDSGIHALLAYFASTIEAKKTEKPDTPMQALGTMRGKRLMDQVDLLIHAMAEEENHLLLLRRQLSRENARQNFRLTFLGIAVFYIGMLFAVWMVTRLERNLADSRAYLKNIINHVADPIFVKDTKHRWIEGNSALWALFSKPEKELLGKSDYDFFPKEEADIFWQKDEEVFRSGAPNINIENFTDASGVTHIISTKKACFKGPNGELILVGVIRDITELTRIQEKLKQSDEARLKSIMDHSGRPVYIKDLEGHYLQVNKDFLALLEREEKDVIGKNDTALFGEKYAELGKQNEQTVIEKATAMEYEEFLPLPDGIHTFTSVKFPLYDANDRIYALCGIANDITERKKVEAQLLRYMRDLERSNQELDDFAYIASHDLKEPLRGLFNHSSFLLEDYKDKLEKDGINRLHRLTYLSQRMERLVNDLLYFSRLGRAELAVQETNPNEIITEIRQMLESFLKEHNAHIVIPKLMPLVVCDKTRITEVFRNLITNAVKYNDKREAVVEIGFLDQVNTASGVERDVFYVKDNGVGIEQEFYQEIFRMFKRLQQSADDKETGTGAGLTFVKKIIERHKGHIWLESEPGVGSIFYFNLNQGEWFHE